MATSETASTRFAGSMTCPPLISKSYVCAASSLTTNRKTSNLWLMESVSGHDEVPFGIGELQNRRQIPLEQIPLLGQPPGGAADSPHVLLSPRISFRDRQSRVSTLHPLRLCSRKRKVGAFHAIHLVRRSYRRVPKVPSGVRPQWNFHLRRL